MSRIVQYDPFAQLRALQQQFWGEDAISQFKAPNIPTTDVYTTGDELVVEAHLPNFSQDNVDVQIDGNELVIQAQQHEKEEDKSKKYVVRESSSSFYRRFQLPERTNADKISAHLDEGVLRIRIPLTPLAQPKKVAVHTKASKKLSD